MFADRCLVLCDVDVVGRGGACIFGSWRCVHISHWQLPMASWHCLGDPHFGWRCSRKERDALCCVVVRDSRRPCVFDATNATLGRPGLWDNLRSHPQEEPQPSKQVCLQIFVAQVLSHLLADRHELEDQPHHEEAFGSPHSKDIVLRHVHHHRCVHCRAQVHRCVSDRWLLRLWRKHLGHQAIGAFLVVMFWAPTSCLIELVGHSSHVKCMESTDALVGRRVLLWLLPLLVRMYIAQGHVWPAQSSMTVQLRKCVVIYFCMANQEWVVAVYDRGPVTKAAFGYLKCTTGSLSGHQGLHFGAAAMRIGFVLFRNGVTMLGDCLPSSLHACLEGQHGFWRCSMMGFRNMLQPPHNAYDMFSLGSGKGAQEFELTIANRKFSFAKTTTTRKSSANSFLWTSRAPHQSPWGKRNGGPASVGRQTLSTSTACSFQL